MKRDLPFGVQIRLWLYRLIFPAIVVFLLPGMVRRMVKRGNFQRHLGQRFGFFTSEFKALFENKTTVWLQSISVGETQVALKIAHEWLSRSPELQIVISVTTSTGYDLAARAENPRIQVIYNPIDLASIVRRTIRAVQPSSLVLIEGTWPVLLTECWRRGIPVSLVARLSPRSTRRFLRFRRLTGPIFNLLNAVFVPENEEINTWISLGAAQKAVHCIGSIKFDEPLKSDVPNTKLADILGLLGVTPDRPILVAGSTFAGEELILSRTFLQLRKSIPSLFLILVPRHVERCPEIIHELAPLDMKIALRSQSQQDARPDVLLVDSTGELRDWYAFATVVFIGKSLTSKGGQNPVEAALLGKPVVFGPHMENFAAITGQWLENQAALQIFNETELTSRLEDLMINPQLRENLAQKAFQIVCVHFGATKRVVDSLISLKI